MSRASRLLSNISYNFLSQFWFLILGLVTTPYIVRKLGADAYGVLSIVSVVMGYFSFLDLGLGAAVVKYVSEYYGRKDYNAIRRALGTAIVVYLIMGLIGAAAIASATGPLVGSILKIPSQLLSVSYFALYIGAFGFLVNMPLNVFGSIPQALQRFDITNKVQICFGTLQTVITILLLYQGFSLKEIVILNLSVSLMSLSAYLLISRRLLPKVSLRPAFDRDMFVSLFKFGGFVAVSRLTATLALQLDRLIIGAFLPISYLTYYTVPYNLASKMWMIPSNVTSAMFPAVSELYGLNEMGALKSLYVRSTKYIWAVVLPLMALFVVLAGQILTLWIGPDFSAKGALSLQILAIGFLVSCSGWTSVTVAHGLGRPDIPAKVHVAQALIGAVLGLLLVPRLGITGAALAWTAHHIIGVPLIIVIVMKQIKTNVRAVVANFWPPFVVTIIMAFLVFILKPFVTSLINLVAVGAIGCTFYFLLAYIFILDKRERGLLGDMSKKLRTKLTVTEVKIR